jgi:hypothetical protein
MVRLSDKARVETHLCPFGDSANLDVRYVHVCAERTKGLKIV